MCTSVRLGARERKVRTAMRCQEQDPEGSKVGRFQAPLAGR